MVCWSKNIILQRGQVGSKIGNFQGYTIMCVLLSQSCPTLCDPMDYSLPGFFVHGILQARILEWVVIPFSMGYSRSRDQTQVSPIAGRFFTIWATRKAHTKIWEWSEVTQSCPTLCDSMDCSPPGFSIHGVFQARILEWVAISFSK